MRSQWHLKLGVPSHSNRLAKSRPVLLLCYSQRHFLYPKGKPKQYRVLAILFSPDRLQYNHAPKQQYFLLAMFDFPLCFHSEKQPDFQPHFLTIAESMLRKLSHNLAGWIRLYHQCKNGRRVQVDYSTEKQDFSCLHLHLKIQYFHQ